MIDNNFNTQVNLNLKQNETEPGMTTHFKPASGFQLRPSLGSAFQPIAIATKTKVTSDAPSTDLVTSALDDQISNE